MEFWWSTSWPELRSSVARRASASTAPTVEPAYCIVNHLRFVQRAISARGERPHIHSLRLVSATPSSVRAGRVVADCNALGRQLIISALGVAAICLRVLETDAVRTKRVERNKNKELRSLAERISSYGHTVHQRYPTGDVIVSERDLAEQLRKRPDAVATALNLLLSEQKVQRAPLRGYWKLNV